MITKYEISLITIASASTAVKNETNEN